MSKVKEQSPIGASLADTRHQASLRFDVNEPGLRPRAWRWKRGDVCGIPSRWDHLLICITTRAEALALADAMVAAAKLLRDRFEGGR